MKYSLIYLACLSASAQSLAQSQPIEKIAVTYKQAYRGDIPQKQMPQSIETLACSFVAFLFFVFDC